MTAKSTPKEIAKKLRATYTMINLALDQAPTDDELDRFKKYLSEQEAIGPLLNPGAFTSGTSFDAISLAKKRVDLLKEVRKHIGESQDVLNRKREES